MECFWYNHTIISCLLRIFVHNYYVQPIYYTYVSKCCESLTDWSIPLSESSNCDHLVECWIIFMSKLMLVRILYIKMFLWILESKSGWKSISVTCPFHPSVNENWLMFKYIYYLETSNINYWTNNKMLRPCTKECTFPHSCESGTHCVLYE